MAIETLNQEQLYAALTEHSDVLVIAGAGSGKTSVIAHRYANICEGSGSPEEICLITFTRKAAGEMQERIKRVFNQRGMDTACLNSRSLLSGTFHSIALKLLRSHGGRIGYDTETMQVITPQDADYLLDQVCIDSGFKNGDKWRNGLSHTKVSNAIQSYYTDGDPVRRDDEDNQNVALIYNEYRQRMLEMNVLDFGALLLECQRLFLKCSDILQHYQDRIKHVIVDELQDANAIQHYGFLDLLWPGGSFFGVGDPRQSIYFFRGSNPLLMHEQHPHATVYTLQSCYRCGAVIVDMANALVKDQGYKDMVCHSGNSGDKYIAADTHDHIRIEVQGLLDKYYSCDDIAILVRSHKTGKIMQEILEAAGCPCHRVGAKFEICNTDEFLVCHAALRLCVNQHDNIAFMRCLNYLNIDPAEYANIRAHAKREGWSDYNAYLMMFAERCDALMPPPVDKLLDDYLTFFEGETGWENVLEFWRDNCTDMRVSDALRWYAMIDNQDDVDSTGKITICTIHAAKGLEWPAVIMPDMNEGKLPSASSINQGTVDEERRVCYVGYTRAKTSLRLMYRLFNSKSHRLRPSRFLMLQSEKGKS